MEAVAAASRIEAAKAQLVSAEALYHQATDMKAAGVVPAIDVLRAQVELQSQRQRFIAYQNDFEKDKLQLVRVIGLPDGQKVRLTDPLPGMRPQNFGVEDMLQKAFQSRMDYRELEARVKTAEYVRKAARSGLFPSLSFHGDYGALGTTPGSSHGTYLAAVSLDFPIFSGGRIRGEELEADAVLVRQRAQLEDLRARIGFEVRSAMLDLKSALERVEVNQSAVDLAKEQDLQARDRFTAGVVNNLEVVQAQEALAKANDSYISSLYSYNVAKVFLARAVGETEKNVGAWLLGVDH
jgi:outer membrane protein TolC